MATVASADRPGLRKTRAAPLLAERSARLWQCNDHTAVRLLSSADVMSEGASRQERGGPVYYGTTSILLAVRSRGGTIPDERLDDALRWSRTDPHLRLRVLRLARREAALRAGAGLLRLDAELAFTKISAGLRIDVEVEAALAVDAARRPA
jgi:hypothetical protein